MIRRKHENKSLQNSQQSVLLDEIREELEIWKGSMCNDPSSFVVRVEKTLEKYLNFAVNHLKVPKITTLLQNFTLNWSEHFDQEDWKSYSTTPSSITQLDTPHCLTCSHNRAALDSLESAHIELLQNLQLQKFDHQKEFSALVKENQSLTKRLKRDFSLEHFYVSQFNRVRTDIQNLLMCELPEVDKRPMKSVPVLVQEIRKVVAQVGKKARSKMVSPYVPNQYICKMEDIFHAERELQLIYEKKQFGVFKLNIGDLKTTLKIQYEQDGGQFSLNFLQRIFMKRNPRHRRLQQVPQEFDNIVNYIKRQLNLQMQTEYRELDQELQSQAQLTYLPHQLSIDGPIIDSFKQQIQSYKQKIQKLSHSQNLLQIKTKELKNLLQAQKQSKDILTLKMKQAQTNLGNISSVFESFQDLQVDQLREEPSKIPLLTDDIFIQQPPTLKKTEQLIKKLQKEKGALLDKLDKKISKQTTEEIKPLSANQQLENFQAQLKEKERQLQVQTDPSKQSRISREIMTLKSKIADTRTNSVLFQTSQMASRLQRSLACIQQSWVLSQEKAKFSRKKEVAQKAKTPQRTQRGHSTQWRIQKAQSSSSFEFRSISSISSTRPAECSEIEFLRSELQKTLESKSKLEQELRALKDSSQLVKKLQQAQAKEIAAQQKIQILKIQEEALAEQSLQVKKHLRSIEKEKQELMALKTKFIKRLNNLRDRESQISRRTRESANSPLEVQRQKIRESVLLLNEENQKLYQQKLALHKEKALLKKKQEKILEIWPAFTKIIENTKKEFK